MKDAFRAEYINTRNILGRKCMQIILEVPLERASEVYDILGFPNPHDSKWVGVALLRIDELGEDELLAEKMAPADD